MERKITSIFLSHLDDPCYADVVKQCGAVILLSPEINTIYLVPAITDTIDRIAPNTTPANIQQCNHHRTIFDARIRALLDYYEDDTSLLFEEYCQPLDSLGVSPFC